MSVVVLIAAVLSAALTIAFLARGIGRALREDAPSRRETSLIVATSLVTGALMLYEFAAALGALLRS
jgi:hypothetical protein